MRQSAYVRTYTACPLHGFWICFSRNENNRFDYVKTFCVDRLFNVWVGCNVMCMFLKTIVKEPAQSVPHRNAEENPSMNKILPV